MLRIRTRYENNRYVVSMKVLMFWMPLTEKKSIREVYRFLRLFSKVARPFKISTMPVKG